MMKRLFAMAASIFRRSVKSFSDEEVAVDEEKPWIAEEQVWANNNKLWATDEQALASAECALTEALDYLSAILPRSERIPASRVEKSSRPQPKPADTHAAHVLRVETIILPRIMNWEKQRIGN